MEEEHAVKWPENEHQKTEEEKKIMNNLSLLKREQHKNYNSGILSIYS